MTENQKDVYRAIIRYYFFDWKMEETRNGFTASYPTSNGNTLNMQFKFIGNDIYFNIKRNNRTIQRMGFTDVNREKLYQIEAYCRTILSVVKCFK